MSPALASGITDRLWSLEDIIARMDADALHLNRAGLTRSGSVEVKERPTLAEVEAAARELHDWGEIHGWWPRSVASYDNLDPIGKDEFDAIVERVLMAANAARAENSN